MCSNLCATGFTFVVLTACACYANPSPHRGTAAAPAHLRADSIGCLDTLRASDTVDAIVKLTAASEDPKVGLTPDFEKFLALAFQARFKAPARLALSLVVGSEPCDSLGSRCAGGVLNIGAVAYVTARANGSLEVDGLVDETLTGDFVNSVRSTLEAMSKNLDVPLLEHADAIPLILTLAPDDDPDTVPAARYLFKAKLPRYDLPFTYAMAPGAGLTPEYPSRGEIAGIGDSVDLAFTVRADGSVAPESIQLLAGNYREFVLSAADALSKTRFHPAHLGDCAVATRVRHHFVFKPH